MNSEKKSSPGYVLSVDEKRQVLYAALLRFEPMADELRDTVLERVILSGLLESTEERRYRLDVIQKKLRKDERLPELHPDVIRETLNRLVARDKVKRIDEKASKSYFLTEKGKAELERAEEEAVDLFEPVLRRMLRNTDHLISVETGEAICRAFIFECFARFGQQIARHVLGYYKTDDWLRLLDVDGVFEFVTRSRKLSGETGDSLRHRCRQFLRSTEHEDKRLKLQLTQWFYFMELLGLGTTGSPFDPLAKQAFQGAVFYLDTNIIVMGLLLGDERQRLFKEMMRMAARLKVELRVTRATINETRHVAARRLEELKRYLTQVPAGLCELTHDQFLTSYLEARTHKPEITPEQFLEPFDCLENRLQNEWKVVVSELSEEEMLKGRKFERETAIIQQEAEGHRPYPKSPSVLRHDVSHLALIGDERANNSKTWFLTDDTSLVRAASRLASEKKVLARMVGSEQQVAARVLPFCFYLASFLQSLSPFTVSSEEEASLADIFSVLLNERLASGKLFDMQEMRILVELNNDIMITPPEQLAPAFDHVTKLVLGGQSYRKDDLPKVALELKKYLSKSVEEHERALEEEVRRQTEETIKEKRARAEVERNAIELRDKVTTFENRMREQSDQIAILQKELTSERQAREDEARQQREYYNLRRRYFMLAGFIGGVVVWLLTNDLVQMLGGYGLNSEGKARAAVTLLGALIFCFPALVYTRSVSWRADAKVFFLGIVICLAVVACLRLFDDSFLSTCANVMQIGTTLAGLIYFVIFSRALNQE